MEITLDQLTAAVSNLSFEVNEIKWLLQRKESSTPSETETLLTVQEAAKFLSLSVPTIYGLISKGELSIIKRSKRCYFSNIELLDYMKAGREKTVSEIKNESGKIFNRAKKGRCKMDNHLITPENGKRQSKNTYWISQLQTIYDYLQNHIATASMVARDTGIPQKNICRYKRDLEKTGQLWEVLRTNCKETGSKAWYLTTDKSKVSTLITKQLNLFPDE